MNRKHEMKTRKRIGILEIYSHHVFVHTLAKIAQVCGNPVTIYTNHRLFKDLEPLFADEIEEFDWEVADEEESDFHFLHRVRSSIDSDVDLLFINSIQGYRILFFYLLNFSTPTVIGAGRISEFFGTKYRFFGFPSFRRMLYHNFSKFFLTLCVPRYRGILVHTDQAKEFAIEHGYSKLIHQLPFSLYERTVDRQRDLNTLHFVVTGSMVEFCRDHKGVLDAFEKLWASGEKRAKLTILSGPKSEYGRALVRRMSEMKKKGFPVEFFTDWVSEEDFLRVAESTDVFISPLHTGYYSKGELTSGVVEAVRQGRPSIYPSDYKPESSLETSSIYYDRIDELPKMIESLLNSPEMVESLIKSAKENSELYSLNSVGQRFESEVIAELLV